MGEKTGVPPPKNNNKISPSDSLANTSNVSLRGDLNSRTYDPQCNEGQVHLVSFMQYAISDPPLTYIYIYLYTVYILTFCQCDLSIWMGKATHWHGWHPYGACNIISQQRSAQVTGGHILHITWPKCIPDHSNNRLYCAEYCQQMIWQVHSNKWYHVTRKPWRLKLFSFLTTIASYYIIVSINLINCMVT